MSEHRDHPDVATTCDLITTTPAVAPLAPIPVRLHGGRITTDKAVWRAALQTARRIRTWTRRTLKEARK